MRDLGFGQAGVGHRLLHGDMGVGRAGSQKAGGAAIDQGFPVDLGRCVHLAAKPQLGVFRREHHARPRVAQRSGDRFGVHPDR